MNAPPKTIFRAGTVLLCLWLVWGTLPVSGADGPVTGSLSLGGLNRYIFRGYRIGDGGFVLQPSLALSCQGFTVSFWGNIDTKEGATPSFVPDRPGRKSFNETDITLSYSRTAGRFNLTAGFIYYGTKYTAETEEFYAGAGLAVPGNPTLTVFQDIDAYPGTYFLFTLAQSFPLAGKTTLDLGASAAYFAGWGEYWMTYDPARAAYLGEKYRALHDGMIKAGLTFPLRGRIGLQALAQIWFPLSDDAARTFDGIAYNINGQLKTVFVFGVNLTYGF